MCGYANAFEIACIQRRIYKEGLTQAIQVSYDHDISSLLHDLQIPLQRNHWKKEGTKGILCKISTNEKTHILGTFGTFNL